MGNLWSLVKGTVWLVVRWISMLAGWSDGFASEAVGAGSTGVASDAPVVGMGEDEFL